MLSEFFEYIAQRLVVFFQEREQTLRPRERFCLHLDTPEIVDSVDKALKAYTAVRNMQGCYRYGTVYSTYTIRLQEKEVVVASKTAGMTDDFLATLRNAEMTEMCFPILMITDSAIDSIVSGTANLSSRGMPFHAEALQARICEEMEAAQLKPIDRLIIATELEYKKEDRFSDKTSLYEYSDILIVLKRGYVKPEDYPRFGLLSDPEGQPFTSDKEIKERLRKNRRHFEQIDHAYRHGNIIDDLEKTYDSSLVKRINDSKRREKDWWEDLTYADVQSSAERISAKLDNPLTITNEDISVYTNSPIEYSFELGHLCFIRNEGSTKAKQRIKNVLIYNPMHQQIVTLCIGSNRIIQNSWIAKRDGIQMITLGRKLKIDINTQGNTQGCTFARIEIHEPLNASAKYLFKICIVDIAPRFLEDIQTIYSIDYARSPRISVCGVTNNLYINPNAESQITAILQPNEVYVCQLDQTLCLTQDENSINTDQGHSDISICCGAVTIPLRIKDESVKPVPISGKQVFILKHKSRDALIFRNDRIVLGTQEYYVKDIQFKDNLKLEEVFIQCACPAISIKLGNIEPLNLIVSPSVKEAYLKLIEAYRQQNQLPSLTRYCGRLAELAQNYLNTVVGELQSIKPGTPLTEEQSNLSLLGCVFDQQDDILIKLGPLHPLNVQYQLTLMNENGVGEIREQLVERLTPLFLLPYLKDPQRIVYHAVEQKHSPEWCYYTQLTNKRYQGARSFVQKLIQEKIEHYEKHFPFLFKDLGNDSFIINLINMGDCREVLEGLIRYYKKRLGEGVAPDQVMRFVINIYDHHTVYNEFSLLSNQKKLREFISNDSSIEINDLLQILPRCIRCYFRNPEDSQYQYAHISFYEMPMADDNGVGRMEEITTGISLDGLTSGIPSVLDKEWYKTGFGVKHARSSPLVDMASLFNAVSSVAFTGSSYEPDTCIFSELKSGQENVRKKIYDSSNWVVFVEPKVDLHFFRESHDCDDELMIIHYSDQYTSASGYDDITVTRKSGHYSDIIYEHLQKKGVFATKDNVQDIISLFNAVNGSWMLKLISTKTPTGAIASNFSREKMSILSAIKVCMAYYAHKDIVWIPISLEEILRVSGGVGLSQNNGLLSAKNLGFEQGPASDDILMIGIEGPKDDLKVYVHPVEVKIGTNLPVVLSKAREQAMKTYNSLLGALWPEDTQKRNSLECRLSRNFLMQLVIVCCEKMKLYNIYPNEQWDLVLSEYRQELLNECYQFSERIVPYIGKGTIISFKADAVGEYGNIADDVCLLEFPEKMGSEYMVCSADWIEKALRIERRALPPALGNVYSTENDTILSRGIDHPFMFIESDDTVSSDEVAQSTALVCNEPAAISENDHTEENSEYLSQNEESLDPGSMQILFGTDISTGEPLYWRPNDTNQVFHTNTGIIGTMGTGKTQFTKSLITQLYRDQIHNYDGSPLGVLIFDYKGDYNESKVDFVSATNAAVLKPYHLPFNPLALTRSKVFKPLLPVHTANAFKATLSKVYELGPKQENTLFTCIIAAYESCGISAGTPATWDSVPPTFDVVYRYYMENEGIKKNDSLAAAMEKLQQFEVFEADPSKTHSLFDLLNGVVVIDLSGYDSDIQSLIVAITLDLFYVQMQAAGSSLSNQQYRQLSKLILVDEADNFMSEGFPALKKILKEGREFGVGTILSTQFLKHFGSGDDDYAKYVLTWVVHNVADLKSSDVEFVFKTEPKSATTQELFNRIKTLQKHQSIVKLGNALPQYIQDKAFWMLYNELQNNQ